MTPLFFTFLIIPHSLTPPCFSDLALARFLKIYIHTYDGEGLAIPHHKRLHFILTAFSSVSYVLAAGWLSCCSPEEVSPPFGHSQRSLLAHSISPPFPLPLYSSQSLPSAENHIQANLPQTKNRDTSRSVVLTRKPASDPSLHRPSSYSQEFLPSLSSIPSIWPVRGRISSPFGKRTCPFSDKPQFHRGLDIAADTGNPVSATADGIVVSCGWQGGYGKSITLSHGSGYVTRYAHLAKIYVQAGQAIRKGEEIGTVGSTGRSTGPHLHYELRSGGIPVNPERYLPDDRIQSSVLCRGAPLNDEHQPAPKGAGR